MPNRRTQGKSRTKRSTTNNNIRRIIRTARTAPLARIRAKPTIRSRGVSSASINALRRFSFFPKKLKADGSLSGKWWLESLKWAGLVAMKILATALSATSLEEFLKQHPLPLEHPLKGKLTKAAIPTGAIIRLAFGPEDFLGETDFVNASTSPAIGHYRQGRLEWVKVIINPTAHPDTRGGMIACAIIPCNRDQMRDDFKVRLTEAHDLNELLKTPGVVYKTATTPTTLTYSPRPAEHAYEWLQFGCQDNSTGLYGSGGDCCMYLDIGVTNLSSDTDDQTVNYSLASTLLDVTIEARVHLREYDEGVYVRTGPVPLTNNETLGVYDNSKTYPVSLADITTHHGICLYEDSLTLDSMSI